MYVLDRDTIVCSPCFQYIHDLTTEQMRRIRYCLFENGISLRLPGIESPQLAQEPSAVASRKRKTVEHETQAEAEGAEGEVTPKQGS